MEAFKTLVANQDDRDAAGNRAMKINPLQPSQLQLLTMAACCASVAGHRRQPARPAILRELRLAIALPSVLLGCPHD